MRARREALGSAPTAGSRLFLSPRGKPWGASANFWRWLQGVFERAGIPRRDELGRLVHVHALRHTFATRLARAGVPIATAQRLTGHASPAMLLTVYTHIGDEESRKAVEGLPALGVGGTLPTATGETQTRPASEVRPL